MSLFREIDYMATAKNVDHFLSHWLPKLILRSGRGLTDLSSPKLSFMPVGHAADDAAETAIVNGMAAETVVQAIHHTIYGCPELSKDILVWTYIDHWTPTKIIQHIPYERTYFFHVLKPDALNYFADGYDYWQARLKVDAGNIRDLHIYKK